MSWYRHEYRDKLTETLTHIEIEPVADIRPHVSSDDCDCLPRLEAGNVMLLIHNAFDGRECFEPNCREKGH